MVRCGLCCLFLFYGFGDPRDLIVRTHSFPPRLSADLNDFKTVFLPTTPHPAAPDWHRDDWEPFWEICEKAGMIPAFHIGTDPVDMTAGGAGVVYRGPGGAVMNYTETTDRKSTRLNSSH